MQLAKDVRELLVIVVGFVGLFLLFGWNGFLWIAGIVGMPGLLFPTIRAFILRAWMTLAGWLGYVNSRIILTVIFYLLLTPLALISRLFTKDRLQLRKKERGESYYLDRNHDYEPEDFKNLW